MGLPSWVLVLVALVPTLDAQCGTAAFSAGAAAVTADCCGASSPASPAGSGHRRLQEGCDVPSVCPDAACAATFTGFFEGCRDELAPLPAAHSYAALFSSCAQLFPSSRPQPAGCRLTVAAAHGLAGDAVVAEVTGCGATTITDATVVARRVLGPDEGADALTGWSELPTAALSPPAERQIVAWATTADDYGRWELALQSRNTGQQAALPVTVWLAPGVTQGSVSPGLYSEEWGLPVVHVAMDGPRAYNGARRPPTPAKQGAMITVRGDTVTGSAHVRGATSAGYAKQSFTLKFDSAELGVHEWHVSAHKPSPPQLDFQRRF